MSETSNPWLGVPSQPPYVLPGDLQRVRDYNSRALEMYKLQRDVLPEPFFGSTTAPVVLLLLNPGFGDRDAEAHAHPRFQDSLRRKYTHGSSEFPFYYLDPGLEGPGRAWWERKLRPLIDHFERKKLANSLLCVQYFPYHSRGFRPGLRLDSQKYGFGLVQSAIARGAVVVIMRGRKLWINEVPELEKYRLAYTLKDPRNVTVSQGNCENFQNVVSAISKAQVDS